jgi:hypothetical protein
MLRKRIVPMAAVAGLAGMLVVFISAGPASAHEERKVGRYVFHVGFGDEPAYAGAKNSVQLLLHDAKTDKPVTSIGDQLKVDVTQGADNDSQKMTMTIEPDFEVGEFGTPGDYGHSSSRPRQAPTPSISPARSTARRSTRSSPPGPTPSPTPTTRRRSSSPSSSPPARSCRLGWTGRTCG